MGTAPGREPKLLVRGVGITTLGHQAASAVIRQAENAELWERGMIRGDEKMIWATVKLEERCPGLKAIKVSLWGQKPVPVPFQALDAASLNRVKNSEIGDTIRIRLWEWMAEKRGLV